MHLDVDNFKLQTLKVCCSLNIHIASSFAYIMQIYSLNIWCSSGGNYCWLLSRDGRFLFSRSGTIHSVAYHNLDDHQRSRDSWLWHGCPIGCEFHRCFANIHVSCTRINFQSIILIICKYYEILIAFSVLHKDLIQFVRYCVDKW